MSKKKHVRKHIHSIRWIDDPFLPLAVNVDYSNLGCPLDYGSCGFHESK